MVKFACPKPTPYNHFMTEFPTFSWSRQHIQFQKTLTGPGPRLAQVALALPQWGRWWIATPLWQWKSEPLDFHRVRLKGTSFLFGRARIELSWTEKSPFTLNWTMTFDPVGPVGMLYWVALWPIHHIVVPLILSQINKKAQIGAQRST